ncbi:methyltransferase domain-containing protein [Mesorhizobium sp. BAC0120]|uniref:class I SAM-dependent methyltransferase n=1 Tax=Mesorhizobium sp. BAC0120 TaxID=3090670 RepID=UPI00298D2029|nr:methyltransferase domain-containing protein [Mesorhizobium sp. BAC0120]MDW6025247.1 methyltransferase domain-containing protein [Mesorhizobium sp. BAC0120]
MSDGKSHETLVGGQFGSRAEAYLRSSVHARGADLDALAALIGERQDARALDLGCGGGHVTFNLAPRVREVVAYDLSPEMLEVVARAARERGFDNVTTEQGVAEKLPFADASFDIALSRFSAHHWRDFGAGLREAARVLKPGGMAVFIDSVSPGVPLLDTYFQTLEMLRDCSHVRNYSRAEWEASLAGAGLLVRATSHFRLRLDFASWVERIGTPKVQVDAIRALQTSVSEIATRHYETEPDGSHSIDVGLFQAFKPGS